MMPEMTAEQRTAWRNVLMAEVEATAPRRSGRPRIAVAAVAAAAVVGAAAYAGLTRPPASGPERAPAMLDAAAQIVAADPVPGPGQYLRVRTRAEYLGTDGAGNGYLSPEVHESFLPADRGRPVIKRTTYLEPTVFFGSGGAALAASDRATHPAVVVERETAAPATALLPRDPRQLLDRLRADDNPAKLPADEFLFDQLAAILRRDGVTAGERAAAYRALALVPGIGVAASTVTLDGTTGTAFALEADGFDSTDEIVIDPGSGRYLGERLVLNRADGAIPAGTLLESTAVTTGVVGEAPHPTTTATAPVQLPRR
jgi:hypothetical protein